MNDARITLTLDKSEAEVLVSMSQGDVRHPRDFVRSLIREEAKRRGVWQPKVQAGGSSAGQDQRDARG